MMHIETNTIEYEKDIGNNAYKGHHHIFFLSHRFRERTGHILPYCQLGQMPISLHIWSSWHSHRWESYDPFEHCSDSKILEYRFCGVKTLRLDKILLSWSIQMRYHVTSIYIHKAFHIKYISGKLYIELWGLLSGNSWAAGGHRKRLLWW